MARMFQSENSSIMRRTVIFLTVLLLFTGVVIAGQSLPPDPGDAGKQSLLGIDSDNDGVRDDIQRYIYFNYPDNERVRTALTYMAMRYQLLLPQSNDRDAALQYATVLTRDAECLFYILGEESVNIKSALKAEILNTQERSITYINFSNNLAGRTIMNAPLKEWKNSCGFDIDSVGDN